MLFSVEDMKNPLLRMFAERWVGGEDVRKEMLQRCKYDGGYIGILGLKDLLFIVHVMNHERKMVRAVHVMPVVCGGEVYEIFMFMDGTSPKGYASFHMANKDAEGGVRGIVRTGWRDMQFKEVMGEFELDIELRDVVVGVYVFDDEGQYGKGGWKLGNNELMDGVCRCYTERGLPIFNRSVMKDELI